MVDHAGGWRFDGKYDGTSENLGLMKYKPEL